MKNKIFTIIALGLVCFLINSCIVTEYSCGKIETRITSLDFQVGTYRSDFFFNEPSFNFDEAGIQIEIAKSIMEEACNEETFTPIPQIIESITISSSSTVYSGGVVYPAGEALNDLFKLFTSGQEYSIPEFIAAQNENPVIFYTDAGPDRIVLQLLDKPDQLISQSFSILFTFKDDETLNVIVPDFEVTN